MSRSGRSVVRPEDAAKAVAAFDAPGGLRLGVAVDQPVAEPLVIALQVVMGRVLLDGVRSVRKPHPRPLPGDGRYHAALS